MNSAPTQWKHEARILNSSQIVDLLIRGLVTITPLMDANQIGATVDIRLGTEFMIKRMNVLSAYDPIAFHQANKAEGIGSVSKYYETIKIFDPTTPFNLHPGEFALGSTLEYIKLPSWIGGQLEGRSGWAREGLNVHSTAGLIHPGHRGIIVFELQNLGTHPLPLYPGTRVGQLLLYELPLVENGTGFSYEEDERAKYAGTMETTFGRPWEDWEFECLSQEKNAGQYR